MAQVIIFPDQHSFEKGLHLLLGDGIPAEPLNPPRFCEGLVAPSVVVTGAQSSLAADLERRGVCVSGANPFCQFKREIPEAAPPDPQWQDTLGQLRVNSVVRSLTDTSKLRVEISLEHDLAPLIPFAARLIRGGAFTPAIPALTFEEEHRLITVAPHEIVISRANDLLDMWVMIRTLIELIRSAREHQGRIRPETEPRQGIGAMELFRRLPGTDCRQCDSGGCMEFATGLITGRTKTARCRPLAQLSDPRHRQSLEWLLRMIGLLDLRHGSVRK